MDRSDLAPARLARRADHDDDSLCQVAAERGVFCRGFRRWNEAEFDRRWRTYIGRSTYLSRAQMEEYANVWQLAEQVRRRVSLACDAQTSGEGPCRGWNEFSNADLARFCCDVLGENVEVVEWLDLQTSDESFASLILVPFCRDNPVPREVACLWGLCVQVFSRLSALASPR